MSRIFKDETSSDVAIAPAGDNGTLAKMAEGDILSGAADEFTGISEQLGTNDAKGSQAATKNAAQGSNKTVTQNEAQFEDQGNYPTEAQIDGYGNAQADAQIDNADSNPDAEPSNPDAEPSNPDAEQDAPEENICEPESEQSDLIENVGEPSGFSEQTDPEQGHAEAFERDLRDLLSEFPELRSALRGGVSTKRYSELRALGLTVREAYLAASAPRGRDNRAHIVSGVPSGARSPELGMSSSEMELARSIFHGLSENEIKRLYSQVTK